MSTKTDPPPLSTPSDDKTFEYEEVTETRIVGITDTGVIRKRSFKRKVRKEDISNRGYGHNHDVYEKILKQVLESKMASESVGGLRQRFRLIQMMHGDCMELIQSWEVTREQRIRRQLSHDFHAVCAVGAAFCVVLFLCWGVFL